MFFFLSNFFASANENMVENWIGKERWVIGNVLNIVRLVGSGIALIALTMMAITYFTSDGKSMPGAVERKADVKGHQLLNFAIGAAVFIGASNLLYFIANFVEDIVKEL